MGIRFRKFVLTGIAAGAGAYLTTSHLMENQNFHIKNVSAEEVMDARQMYRRVKRSLPQRSEQIKSLQNDSFDVLIIGGGATGSGCALDAVSRGLVSNILLNFA